MLHRQARYIGGGAEEGGMAEREVAGEAEQDVEAECEDGPDHDLGRERLVAVEPDDPLRHRQYDDGKDGEDEKIRAGDQSRLGTAGTRPLRAARSEARGGGTKRGSKG